MLLLMLRLDMLIGLPLLWPDELRRDTAGGRLKEADLLFFKDKWSGIFGSAFVYLVAASFGSKLR